MSESEKATPSPSIFVGALRIAANPAFLISISDSYAEDKWVHRLADTLWDAVAKDRVAMEHEGEELNMDNVTSLSTLRCGWLDGCDKMGIVVHGGLLYIGDRMVVPRIKELRESSDKLPASQGSRGI